MAWRRLPVAGPVTSLAFLDNLLFAGIGPYLHNISLETGNHPSTDQVLTNERIHKICELKRNDGNIIVACSGILELAVVQFNSLDKTVTTKHNSWKFNDRILDIKALSNNREVAIVLGYNNVVRFDYENWRIEQQIFCQDCSILYSAHVIGNTWGDLVITAGSVFNQVLVWAPTDTALTAVPVIQRLTGHDGVIFSIDYHENKKLLCSASDDRSIRVWNLKSAIETSSLKQLLISGVFELQIVLYGHTARIWDVRLLNDVIVSIGEDATCCEWTYQGDIHRRNSFNNTKSIRSLAINAEENKIATAGEDGSIQVRQREEDNCSCESHSTSLIDHHTMKDFPREVKLLSSDSVIIFTDVGLLYLYTISKRNWTKLLEDPLFRGYCSMAVDRKSSTIAIGNINGLVKMCHFNTDTLQVLAKDTKIHSQKVTPLLWLTLEESSNIVTTLKVDGQAFIIIFKLDQTDLSLHHHRRIELQSSQHTIINCVAFWQGAGTLVTGDKKGFLITYGADDKPIQKHKAHSKGGVTCFLQNHDSFTSAGKDGTVNVYKWVDNNLKMLSSFKPINSVEWIHSLFDRDDGQILAGYHSVSFQLWDMTRKQKLCEIDCGGGHRLNDVILQKNDSVFVYVRKEAMIVNTFSLTNQQTIVRQPVHGREVTALVHLVSLIVNGKPQHIVASASEDTTCKILSLSDEGNVAVLTVMQCHVSAVKSACSILKSSDCHLLITCGGRGQLNVVKVLINHKVKITCEVQHLLTYCCLNEGTDLRFMAVAAVSASDISSHYPDNVLYVFLASSDGCVRILSLNETAQTIQLIAESNEQSQSGCLLDIRLCVHLLPLVVLATCSSNGQVTFWDVGKHIRAAHCFRCLDGVTTDKQKTIVNALKDRTPVQQLVPSYCLKVHLAGISALRFRQVDGGVLMVTGGDDNSIVASLLRFDVILNRLVVSVIKTTSYKQLHASNITGVQFITNEMITISSDQRIGIWKLAETDVEPVSLLYSCVADMLSACSWTLDEKKYVVVGGIGIQLFCRDSS